jgi:hypothetical protein
MSRLPHFLDNQLTDGDETVSLTHCLPFTSRKIRGTHLAGKISAGHCQQSFSVLDPVGLRTTFFCLTTLGVMGLAGCPYIVSLCNDGKTPALTPPLLLCVYLLLWQHGLTSQRKAMDTSLNQKFWLICIMSHY